MNTVTDESSVPEMRIWSILLIKSDLKWCIHLSRSLILYIIANVKVFQKYVKIRGQGHKIKNYGTKWKVLSQGIRMCNMKEQDKSSDIEQQPPFGDRKISNIQPQNRGGVQN